MAGGGVTFVAALFIARFMPSRHQDYGDEAGAQTDDPLGRMLVIASPALF